MNKIQVATSIDADGVCNILWICVGDKTIQTQYDDRVQYIYIYNKPHMHLHKCMYR